MSLRRIPVTESMNRSTSNLDALVHALSEGPLRHLALVIERRHGMKLELVGFRREGDEIPREEKDDVEGVSRSISHLGFEEIFITLPDKSQLILSLVPSRFTRTDREHRNGDSDASLDSESLSKAKEEAQLGMELILSGMEASGAFETSVRANAQSDLRDIETLFKIDERVHEARTSIAAIQGFSELLLEELTSALNEDQLEGLQIIHDRSVRLAELFTLPIEAAIGVSLYQSSMDEVRLKSLISRIVSGFYFELKRRNIQLEIICEDEPIHLETRPLETIVRNLVENALNASAEGGQIRITARRIMTPSMADDALEIIVEDSGCGIPPGALPMERRDGSGQGIGLALVGEILRARGGALSTGPSRSLGGACFHVRLPLRTR